ncbi:MAG TPA: hypothetical protein VFK86_20535 [Bauldia sp.]|nr:hypothetical protein [Bauldia sp.]
MARRRTKTAGEQPDKAVRTRQRGQPKHDGGTSPWEWAAAGIGCLILGAIVGYLIYEGTILPPQAYPEIAVVGETPVALSDGTFLVPIEVENHGHVTGAGVGVSGALLDADGTVIEESTVTFDFVAQHSIARGGLYFTADPRERRLVLRVEGYTDP